MMKMKYTLFTSMMMTFMSAVQAAEGLNPNPEEIRGMIHQYQIDLENGGKDPYVLYNNFQEQITAKMGAHEELPGLLFDSFQWLCGSLPEKEKDDLFKEYALNSSNPIRNRMYAADRIENLEACPEVYASLSPEITEKIKSGEVSQEDAFGAIFRLLQRLSNQAENDILVLEYVNNPDMPISDRCQAVSWIKDETEKNNARILMASEIFEKMEKGEMTRDDGENKFYVLGIGEGYQAIAESSSVGFKNRIKAAQNMRYMDKATQVYQKICYELRESIVSEKTPQKEGSELILSLMSKILKDPNEGYLQYIKDSKMDLDCRFQAVDFIANNKRTEAYAAILLDTSVHLDTIVEKITGNSKILSPVLKTKLSQVDQLILNDEANQTDKAIRLIDILYKIGQIDIGYIQSMILNPPMPEAYQVKMVKWIETNSFGFNSFDFFLGILRTGKVMNTKTPWIEFLREKAGIREIKIKMIGSLKGIVSSIKSEPQVRVNAAYFLTSLGDFYGAKVSLQDLILRHRNGILKEFCEELEKDASILEHIKPDVAEWKALLTKPV